MWDLVSRHRVDCKVDIWALGVSGRFRLESQKVLQEGVSEHATVHSEQKHRVSQAWIKYR